MNLSEREKTDLAELLKKKRQQNVATAVANLYLGKKEQQLLLRRPPDITPICAVRVVCLVKDYARRSYFVVGVDLASLTEVWEHELRLGMDYQSCYPWLHSFNTKGEWEETAIISFADDAEAKDFMFAVRLNLGKLQSREKNRSTWVLYDEIDNNINNNINKEAEDTTKKAVRARKGLSKADIGRPKDFVHVNGIRASVAGFHRVDNMDSVDARVRPMFAPTAPLPKTMTVEKEKPVYAKVQEKTNRVSKVKEDEEEQRYANIPKLDMTYSTVRDSQSPPVDTEENVYATVMGEEEEEEGIYSKTDTLNRMPVRAPPPVPASSLGIPAWIKEEKRKKRLMGENKEPKPPPPPITPRKFKGRADSKKDKSSNNGEEKTNSVVVVATIEHTTEVNSNSDFRGDIAVTPTLSNSPTLLDSMAPALADKCVKNMNSEQKSEINSLVFPADLMEFQDDVPLPNPKELTKPATPTTPTPPALTIATATTTITATVSTPTTPMTPTSFGFPVAAPRQPKPQLNKVPPIIPEKPKLLKLNNTTTKDAKVNGESEEQAVAVVSPVLEGRDAGDEAVAAPVVVPDVQAATEDFLRPEKATTPAKPPRSNRVSSTNESSNL